MLPLLIVFSYLMGSIPSGYILVKKKLNKDVREYGSGNIGATNVRRVAGEKLSKITAICDMIKAKLTIVASCVENLVLNIKYVVNPRHITEGLNL